MNWLADVPESRRRRYLILISIIIAAGICYCAGIAALLFAPSNQTIMATFIESPMPSNTMNRTRRVGGGMARRNWMIGST